MLRTFIVIAIITTLTACSNTKKPKPNSNIPPKFVDSKKPTFKHDANLWFIDNNNDTIQRIEVELANTISKRDKGLINRKQMNKNNGMLFIFDTEERQSFTMENIHIPLDIIFVNAELNIIHIAANCKPYSLNPIPSFEYAQYAIEVLGGYCSEMHINIGDKIKYTAL